MIATVLTLMFQLFPTPVSIFILAVIALMLIVIVIKIVALVLDAIPFL